MTMALIHPPRLRTTHDDAIALNFNNVEVFQKSSFFPSNELYNSSFFSTRKSSHHCNKRRRRNVSFHSLVTVVEVERVSKSESTGVWWTFGEMDRFRSEAGRSKERRRRGMKRSARSTSHVRKVLVQQCASEELDGVASDPKLLSLIASDSSRKARECAYLSAQKLEKEIEKEVYSDERSNSIVSPLPLSIPVRSVDDRRIKDFYWGAVVDAFTETVICGMVPKVAY
jgi:hypothetical protein